MAVRPVTTQPVRIVQAGDPPGVVVNRDLTNQVLWGSDNTIVGDNPNSASILDPLVGIPVDGKHDIYCAATGPEVLVDYIPYGQNWTPSPAQQAAQISALGLAKDSTVSTVNATLGSPSQDASVKSLSAPGKTVAQDVALNGVGMLRFANNLGNNTGQTLAGGSPVKLLDAVTVSQPSYELLLSVEQIAVGGTIPFVRVDISFTDASGNFLYPTDSFIATAGQVAFLDVFATAPCRGSKITVKLTNLDPAISVGYSWSVSQTSHVYDVFRVLEETNTVIAVAVFSRPGIDTLTGNLGSMAPVVNAGATATRLCAAFSGLAQLNIDNSAGANACNVTLGDPEGSTANSLYSMSGTAAIDSFEVAAGGMLNSEVNLPNGPVLVTIKNTGGAGSISPTVTLTRKLDR